MNLYSKTHSNVHLPRVTIVVLAIALLAACNDLLPLPEKPDDEPETCIRYVNRKLPLYVSTGLKWDQAFPKIQEGLTAAEQLFADGKCSDGVQIWVAKGKYYPDSSGLEDPRQAVFQLINGVELYGGFSGNGDETTTDERNFDLYETELVGQVDINQIDGENVDDDPDYKPSFHVVIGADNATIDGFTIRDGESTNGDGTISSLTCGGGMYNEGVSPTVVNCKFVGNFAKYGAGMCNINASPLVSHCVFEQNEAVTQGGGMVNTNSSAPKIIHTEFKENDSNSRGGGISNLDKSYIELVNCIFTSNSAGQDGGAIFNYDASYTLSNSLLSGNYAGVNGGGLGFQSSGVAVSYITNCTFDGNNVGGVAGSGNAIWNYESRVIVTNSIVWRLSITGEQILFDDQSKTGLMRTTYSDIRGDCPIPTCTDDTTGNIHDYPMFTNSNQDDFSLLKFSPCIGEGRNDALPFDTLDLDEDGDTDELLPLDGEGNPRVVGGSVDMGYLEFQGG